ncbi:tryptophanyl-tRNA synthetase [Saccharothrix coeruleofusca]|uniref:tryptophan--tRNA ligase n=1 Tax=Saccharothrix coeruleofusca TaxID=33919 RepID=UPI001AE3D726|nr:tryptophan--tRNA ligase [Saccharothrix coeruleofusca]MBP2334753.1 tryptophanyl-tRNA synthetase [Saccharothrix coeruleofusca]
MDHPENNAVDGELTDRSFADAEARSARLEEELRTDPTAHRMLTGDRPTGPLHLGHYFGTLRNRVRLQDLGVQMFVLVADYQTITDRDSPRSLPEDVDALLADYLSVGIDPEHTTIFAHSQISGLNQLFLPFLSMVSVAELNRNPTVKDETAAAGQAAMSGLMFTYPVHQAADILFCKGTVVPVGKDQLPHLEVARVIARRFNRRYSPKRRYFPEPAALLSEAPVLLGTDGQKMSKSRNNAIALSATADETARLLSRAKTDAERHITYDPVSRPDVSNLVLLAALCLERQPEAVAEEVGAGGAAALKRLVTEAVNERFRDIRKQRAELINDRAQLRRILAAGNERAAEIADATLADVKRLMHTDYGS